METTATPTGSIGHHGITDDWCLHHFDHQSPELAADFPATLARMRALCPVARSDSYGGFWVVTRYDDVLAVAQDWEAFSSAYGLSIPPSPIAVRNLPVEVDPPAHRVFKRLINAYFTPAAVAPWEDRARGLAVRLIDTFASRGSCEFMAEFARPYPALSFFDVAINAPAEDVEKVAYFASKSSTPDDPEAAACWAGLSQWIDSFIDKRREQDPKGDVVDAVISAQVDGRPITREEIIGTVQLLILGGLETTAGALGAMMIRLCDEPGFAESLRSRPELIPRAVEEMLRLDAPFIAVARTAMRDTQIGGQPIKAGDKVLIYWASANRDEAEFAEPDRLDLDRSSNRHLAFGAGPHRCAGSNLARLNLSVSLEELLRRLRDLRLADGAPIEFHSTLTRAPLRLPICFRG